MVGELRLWLETAADLLSVHVLCWEVSAAYKAWWRALLARRRRTRITGRLAADVSDALRAGGLG